MFYAEFYMCGMKAARDTVGMTFTASRDLQTNELCGETVSGCQLSKSILKCIYYLYHLRGCG